MPMSVPSRWDRTTRGDARDLRSCVMGTADRRLGTIGRLLAASEVRDDATHHRCNIVSRTKDNYLEPNLFPQD